MTPAVPPAGSSLAPTAKITAVGATGSVITLTLQLLQQYVHGFALPSAATVSLIITVVTTAAGWLTRETRKVKP